ncbi:MAG: hypothetical protein U0575_04545 [Phycisphaerales bacterium]
MRWGVFLVVALVAAACDTSLTALLSIGTIVPQLMPLVAVFVALAAPRTTVLWACLFMGLVVDLCSPAFDAQLRPLHLAGPHALGYLFAANLVLPLRTMVLKRNPLTLGALTAIFSMAASLVVVALWSVRTWYPDPPVVFGGDSALTELGRAGLRALYSGAIAVPIGWFLVRTAPLWGFSPSGQRGARW